MTKRNPEFGGFSACFAVRAETDQKGKATPPARTETWCGALTPLAGINFNPLRPRGRRRLNQDRTASIRNFNPLRPRGRRHNRNFKSFPEHVFQPTPPARTETHQWYTQNSVGQFQPTPPARTETAILHKKTNNSSSHFHNQITSYSLKSPPTCPAHIQNRSHCAVFPVRIPP